MSTLFGNNISQTYQGLIKLADSTTGVTATTQSLQDGLGNNIPIQVSNTTVNISGSFLVNGQPVSIETGSFATTGSNTFIGNQTISGSLDVTGTITANSASFNYLETIFETASIIYSSGSNQLGDELSDIQTLSGSVKVQGELLVNGVAVVTGSVNRDGLITTGSITDTQEITGSLILGNTIISGSLIGNSVNGNIIKIQTEANRSGSNQFNITGSNPTGSVNIVFGSALASNFSGSVVISGSNNILFNGNRFGNPGNYGYIGNQNIVTNIPTLNTGSLIRPGLNFNQINGLLNMNFTTSSVFTPGISNNLIYSQVTLNSQSGSVNYNSNINTNIITLNQNSQPLTGSNTTITNNNIGGSITLNAISSSIRLTNNTIFGTNTFVTSSYFNSSSFFSTSSFNNEGQVQQNIIGGFNNHIQFGGNPSTNVARSFSTNILGGIGNVVNMNATGSDTNMFSSIIYGNNLSVNPQTNISGLAVFGSYNKPITGSTVFVVGNGTGTGDRKNAIEVSTAGGVNETILSGSVKIAASSNAGHPPSLVIGAFNNNNAAANITGSVNVSGSIVLNGVPIGASDRNGLITTGSATTYPTQTIYGSLQISSGSLFARGKNPSGNNLAYGEFALASITSANSNTGLGNNALSSATTGGGNLAVGGAALSNMTTGQNNVGIGNQALLNNISGSNNTAIGANTLQNNVAGFNLAIGTDALKNNTTGQYNNAIGDASLYNNTTGEQNTAIGKNTLFFNTTGGYNLGIGGGALGTNVSGSNNVAVGNSALQNSVSSFNLAVGGAALSANTTGENNVAIGQSSFQSNTTGGKNTAIGWNSGVNNLAGSTNTIIGAQALQENINGSGNVAIGYGAGYYSTGSNGFYVGNDNYGSLNAEQNKSLMYGKFDTTTANQTLQINAQTNISGSLSVNGVPVGGSDRNGLITTGSLGGSQSITGSLIVNGSQSITGSVDIEGNFPGDPGKTFVIRSGSMKMGDFNNSIRIATLNNQPQLFFNETRKVGFFLGQSNMDQVDTQFGIVSGSENIYTMGGNFNNFRSGSFNLMLGINNISIKSGSNNIILAKSTSYTTGSNNLILGSLQGVDEAQNYFNLQLPNSNDPIMFKSGSAPLTISSSLKVTDGANITGSLNVTGSITLNGVAIGGSDRNGLITTGSLGGSSQQNITGSLIISGSGPGGNTIYVKQGSVYVEKGNLYVVGQSGGQTNVGIAGGFGGYDSTIGLDSDAGTLTQNPNSAGMRIIKQAATGGKRYGLYVGNLGYGSNPPNGMFISSSVPAGSGSFIGFNAGTGSVTLGNYVFANSDDTQTRVYISGSLSAIGDVKFASGSNKTMGTVALDGGNPGTITVSNSLVTTGSMIFLTKQTLVHPNGYVAVSSKGSGTFTITSNHNGDTDTVAYQIINPA